MDPTPDQITALADQLSQLAKSVAASTDPKEKKRQTQALVLQARKMIAEVQDPFDAIMDHVVNAYTIASILALMEIGVFEAMPMHGSISTQELTEKCQADESLITRLLRQLLCVGIFASTSPGIYSHNRLSIGLSDHIGMTGKYFYEVAMDEMLPSFNRLNRFIRQYGKKDVTSYTTTPHSWYDDKVGQNFWQVLSSDGTGARLQRFAKGLSLFAALHPVVAMFPFAEALKTGNSPDRPLCVDIGGGRGLAMLELRQGCPDLQGQMILQDRSAVLDDIPEKELPGVTKMAHDFFTEQPIKNAQVYYIRRVMHDWQDADAAKILTSVVPAMSKDSRILVSDMCMPDPVGMQDAGAIWLDLMMMTIGGKERTSSDWQKLAEMSGLKLAKIWQEPEKFGPLCVVEYVLPSAEDKTAESEGTKSGTNGIAMHYEGTKSELALAENVQMPVHNAEDPAEETKTEEPTELTGASAEAKAYGETEVLSQQHSQTEIQAPMEVLTGDMHSTGVGEGVPVVVK